MINKRKKIIILRNLLLSVVFFAMIAIPLVGYIFTKYSSENYIYKKQYYAITTTKGNEKGKLFRPSYKPITNIETTKEWLKKSLVDIFTNNALDYNTKERKKRIKLFFAPESFNSYWENEQGIIKDEISKGILRNSSIISYKPNLLGEGTMLDGSKIWKFYLEINTSSDSQFSSFPIARKRQVIAYVREINPKENIKGIGIYKLDVK